MYITINPVSPIQWGQSLNRGRIAWWLATRQSFGGLRWIDLVSRSVGTLTSFSTTNYWQGANRAGGFGHLSMSTSYVAFPAVSLAGDFTVSFWEYFNSGLTISNNYVSIGQASSASNINHFSGTARLWDSVANQDQVVASTSTPIGKWHHFTFTRVGTTYTIYLNGVSNKVSTGILFTWTPAFWGAAGSGAISPSISLDDMSIWNRGLSAAEVVANYSLSLQGHPLELNTPPMTLLSIPASSIIGQSMFLAV